jgi:hypothetical protein
MKPRGFADFGPAALLLECLSAGREPTTDWKEVVDVAVREHVAPLLFRRLKESGAQARVPETAWRRLRLAYFTSSDRNTRLFREIRTVLESLRGSGIPVIVLKGACLAEAVYEDPALRPMCDVDLLVPRAELARAEAVLLRAAAVPREAGRAKARHVPPVLVRDLAVEIHWTIADPAGPVRVDPAGLWDRARPARVAGADALSLSPEDLLLHLCLHFCCQNGCVGLRHLCDIAETIRRFHGEMDWPQVACLARAWGADRYVGLALLLAGSMLGAEVPGEVLERLVPGGLDANLLGKARECVLAQEPFHTWALLPFPNRLGGKSSWGKVQALRQAVFPSRYKMGRRYPVSRGARHLWPYYVLRLVDLPLRYGVSTLRQGLRMMRARKSDNVPSLAKWLRTGKP